jgi:molybdate transport system substrate-binding protein
MRRLWRAVGLAVAVLPLLAVPIRAADLQVLAAGAVKSVLPKLAATFERESGHTVRFVYGSVGDLAGKLRSGALADVILVTPQALAGLAGQGLVQRAPHAAVGSVGVGLAVRAGVPVPDVSTPDALRATLLAARKVIYSDPAQASASIHFATVIERLGIAAQVRAKAHVAPNGIVGMEDLAADTGPGLVLGVTQLTEVPLHPNVRLAGPLPGALQQVTTYAAAVTAKPADPPAAEAFLRWITNPAARESFAAAGFTVQ